jgi:hypothetical protein
MVTLSPLDAPVYEDLRVPLQPPYEQPRFNQLNYYNEYARPRELPPARRLGRNLGDAFAMAAGAYQHTDKVTPVYTDLRAALTGDEMDVPITFGAFQVPLRKN